MTIAITSPASLFDMAELCGAHSPAAWAVAREMWAGGQSWAIRDRDELAAIVGLYPIAGTDRAVEAWFNFAPGASRHMLAICRAAKLTIRGGEYSEIVAVVSTDVGRRIARAIGLRFFKATELGEIWLVYSAETAGGISPKGNSRRSSAKA